MRQNQQIPVRALRHYFWWGCWIQSDEHGTSESTNARKGIKTQFSYGSTFHFFPSESTNARKGIKTQGARLLFFCRHQRQNQQMPVRALRLTQNVFPNIQL